MRYGSVCSGVEAASLAWEPLGWTPVWFAEIDPHASAVLAARWPHVPNHGDFTRIGRDLDVQPVELLAGGTPCQSFSIAGNRAGLDDPRGILTLEFFALVGRLRPRWVVWENVRDVLSSDDGWALGAVLGILAELGYGFAYRVLDAQWFGVPQRRRRVFLVAHSGAEWQRAAAVLFESSSLRRNLEASRGAQEDTAGTLGGSPVGSGWRADTDRMTFLPVACTLRAGGHDASGDGRSGGTPIVPVLPFDTTQITSKANVSSPQYGDPCHPLVSRAHPSAIVTPLLASGACGANGAGIGQEGDPAFTLDTTGALAVAFHNRQDPDVSGDVTHPLGAKDNGLAVMVPERERALTARNQRIDGETETFAVTPMSVRRLMPVECERLQAMPDGHSAITYKGKPLADGPRYRLIGNSWAVVVPQWIGARIQALESATS